MEEGVVLHGPDAMRIIKRGGRRLVISHVDSIMTSVFSLGDDQIIVHSLARGLEEQRNFEELLTESVGRVHFS